jgi:hypothetical protein
VAKWFIKAMSSIIASKNGTNCELILKSKWFAHFCAGTLWLIGIKSIVKVCIDEYF